MNEGLGWGEVKGERVSGGLGWRVEGLNRGLMGRGLMRGLGVGKIGGVGVKMIARGMGVRWEWRSSGLVTGAGGGRDTMGTGGAAVGGNRRVRRQWGAGGFTKRGTGGSGCNWGCCEGHMGGMRKSSSNREMGVAMGDQAAVQGCSAEGNWETEYNGGAGGVALGGSGRNGGVIMQWGGMGASGCSGEDLG